MNNSLLIAYFAVINVVSGVLFTFDKYAATKGQRRVPERTLHFSEILGGVFANIVLMYALRHKNRKFSYWIWTWMLMIGWLIFLFEF